MIDLISYIVECDDLKLNRFNPDNHCSDDNTIYNVVFYKSNHVNYIATVYNIRIANKRKSKKICNE